MENANERKVFFFFFDVTSMNIENWQVGLSVCVSVFVMIETTFIFVGDFQTARDRNRIRPENPMLVKVVLISKLVPLLPKAPIQVLFYMRIRPID